MMIVMAMTSDMMTLTLMLLMTMMMVMVLAVGWFCRRASAGWRICRGRV
jgi:hypothetical protein